MDLHGGMTRWCRSRLLISTNLIGWQLLLLLYSGIVIKEGIGITHSLALHKDNKFRQCDYSSPISWTSFHQQVAVITVFVAFHYVFSSSCAQSISQLYWSSIHRLQELSELYRSSIHQSQERWELSQSPTGQAFTNCRSSESSEAKYDSPTMTSIFLFWGMRTCVFRGPNMINYIFSSQLQTLSNGKRLSLQQEETRPYIYVLGFPLGCRVCCWV